MQVRSKDTFKAITFDELVAHGKAQPDANIVDGLPWSFRYEGWPVTHETDDCYIVTQAEGFTAPFERGAMLLFDKQSGLVPVTMEEFHEHFEPLELKTDAAAPVAAPLAPIPPAEILADLTPQERAAQEQWSLVRHPWGCEAEHGDKRVFVPS